MRAAGHADVSADGIVKAASGELVAVVLAAGSGAAATLILYDNASAATGTVLCKLAAVQGGSASFCPAYTIAATKGIYADIGGTGANATVVYL